MHTEYTPPKSIVELLERRIIRLLDKRTHAELATFFNNTVDDQTLSGIQQVLDRRWNELVVEYKELDRVNRELAQRGLELTGLHARPDPRDSNRVNITPGIKVINYGKATQPA